jgi:hypothetical protein
MNACSTKVPDFSDKTAVAEGGGLGDTSSTMRTPAVETGSAALEDKLAAFLRIAEERRGQLMWMAQRMTNNREDAEPLSQRVGFVAAVGYDALRLLPRTAAQPGDADFGDCGLRKLNFTRGGTFQPNSHRMTFTVDQYHPLRPLATLGFADCGAPF